MLKNYEIAVVVLALILVLAGLGYVYIQNVKPQVNQTKEIYINVTDALGRVVKVPTNISRIIVLDSGSAEIVYALGMGDKIVGRLDSIVFPPSIINATPLSYTTGVDLEKLASLHPDIIITYIRTQKELQSYETHNFTVIGVPWTNSINDLYNIINIIGKALNREDRAKFVISFLNSTIYNISKAVEKTELRPKVLFIRSIGTNGIQIVTTGIENNLIRLAGGISLSENLIPNTSFTFINYEDLIRMNPDVIILSYRVSQNVSDLISDPRLQSVNAIKFGNVYKLPKEFTPTSPRFVLMLAFFAKSIHPEISSNINITELRYNLYKQVYGLSDDEINKIS